MQDNDDKLIFRKSSYSNGSGECVEVAVKHNDGRAVRDSKDHRGPVLHFASSEWAAFVKGVRADEFDA